MKEPIKIIYKKLGRQKSWGLAYKDDREIHIDSNLKGKDLLTVIIHEALHVQNSTWAEIKVEGHAKELAELLYKEGYRKIVE